MRLICASEEGIRRCLDRLTKDDGILSYRAAAEKYLGIIKARSGRMAGKHAHTIPTLASTADNAA